MYAVLSPAKKLVEPNARLTLTPQLFANDAKELVSIMNTKTVSDLQSLMGISENLSLLNVERFSTFGKTLTPSILTFAGDTYQGLNAGTLSQADLEFAQAHLGILSGLYGLLRPFDGISPYRLEMGTKLKTDRGNSLYEFWGSKITLKLDELVANSGSSYLINLASNEYFSAVKKPELTTQVISPVFKDVRKGKAKVISFLAKRARGMMARFITVNRLSHPSELRDFNTAGYRYNPDLSSETAPVFIREEGVQ